MEKEKFIKICEESLSMRESAKRLKMKPYEFWKLATKYGCYKPNQGGKGINKPQSTKLLTEDILAGKYPKYQTCKLKDRLFKEGLKEKKCEECGIKEWNGQLIKMELHHQDGNNKNHLWKNLMILCPNCHSQTSTYCRKK